MAHSSKKGTRESRKVQSSVSLIRKRKEILGDDVSSLLENDEVAMVKLELHIATITR